MDKDSSSLDNDLILCETAESQGHGKSWEIDIQKNIFQLTDEQICLHKHTEKYDIKSEFNSINDQNVSIKTSSSSSIDCGDINLFLSSENLMLVIVHYNQEGDIKVAQSTNVIDFQEFLEILKMDVPKYCNMEYEEWLRALNDYVQLVKSIPPGRCEDKSYKNVKKQLCQKIPYFNIAPKVDSKSQRRVQCAVNFNKIDDLNRQSFDGGMLFDRKYTKSMNSKKRIRHEKLFKV